MAPSRCAIPLGMVLTLAICANSPIDAYAAPIIWTGPTITFTKTGFDTADTSDPLNQDRLTDNVWLTRGADEGMFNVAPNSNDIVFGEPHYVRFTSPDDTAWATSVMPANASQTIAATNWQNLSFTTWAAAYGGPGSALSANITTHNAVVHLITDDIYLDLRFLPPFASGGDFTYQRSTPAVVPEPAPILLVLVSMAIAIAIGMARRCRSSKLPFLATGLAMFISLVGSKRSAEAAFHLWQIQEVFTTADGSVQFIEMHDNNPFETSTGGTTLTATSDGIPKSFTLSSLSKPTPGSLLFATSGFGSLAGAVTPDFTLPSTSFFNPNATNITISFSGSGDSISFTGASLPHDGINSLTDTNLGSTPNLVSGTNSPMNLNGNSGSVNLSTPPPTGDYNGNHSVDAADYVAWRKTLNQSASPAGSGADGNSSGTVDAGDYTFWRQHFGNAAGSGTTVGPISAIPEPLAAVILLMTFPAFTALRRRR